MELHFPIGKSDKKRHVVSGFANEVIGEVVIYFQKVVEKN